jgi:hypothetical protein
MSLSVSNRASRAALVLAALAASLVIDPGYADPGKALAAPAAGTRLAAARFTESGELVRPDDLDEWVFLGASLGLGYDEAKRDPGDPGDFQVVLMEPSAYAYFKTHGAYADGSMFLLSLYFTEQRTSTGQAGFAQGDLKNFEIHLIERERFAEGRAFYLFRKDGGHAAALPAGNPCVECHLRDGAFDGTFAQFYPALRHRIPSELLHNSLRNDARH